jgi:hypothetical protein
VPFAAYWVLRNELRSTVVETTEVAEVATTFLDRVRLYVEEGALKALVTGLRPAPQLRMVATLIEFAADGRLLDQHVLARSAALVDPRATPWVTLLARDSRSAQEARSTLSLNRALGSTSWATDH